VRPIDNIGYIDFYSEEKKMKKHTLIFLISLIYYSPTLAQKVGEAAPNFSHSTVEHGTISLSEFRGKAVYLFFFGHGWGACILSGPDTEALINQNYNSQNFQAIGLDYWSGSNSSNVGQFQTATGITYPLCINASGTRTAYQAYEDLDVSIVIDQEGIVRYRGGGVPVSSIKSVIDNLITASSLEEGKILQTYELNQNYPNPFNPSTNISFNLGTIQNVSLKIYDNQGRLVRTLLENTLQSGKHEISWDGRNNYGHIVSAGTYYYFLKSDSFNETKKMLLLR
jgi:peroxiredoxin